ncbi:MAG: hypothetical protein M3Z08_13660 [Chloroflexota bacterium]|nr:hypothetical protein [Chloroflexota bacterium]
MRKQHDTPATGVKSFPRYPFLLLGLAVVVLLVLTVGINMERSAAAGNSPSIVITNSGSTNMPGSTLTINRDGSGSITYEKEVLGQTLKHVTNKAFSAHTFDTGQLEQMLNEVGSVDKIPNHGCLKSMSFGSTTTITYQGKTSGDVSCISQADEKIHQDIAHLVLHLYSQAR